MTGSFPLFLFVCINAYFIVKERFLVVYDLKFLKNQRFQPQIYTFLPIKFKIEPAGCNGNMAHGIAPLVWRQFYSLPIVQNDCYAVKAVCGIRSDDISPAKMNRCLH